MHLVVAIIIELRNMNKVESTDKQNKSHKIAFCGSTLFLVVCVFLKVFLSLDETNGISSQDTSSFWEKSDSWYLDTLSTDSNQIDVFYLISTDVVSAKDSCGQEVWRSTLSKEDRAAMEKEMSYVRNKLFYGDFNFFSPYYHQFTFDVILQPDDTLNTVRQDVAEEVCEAFDYYMKHWNNGRRFVLAGFSQGAMHMLDLLRHMSDEQFSRMVAAYEIGYRLSEADLQHPHIRPALGETDSQVVVSFNSVLSPQGIWPLVSEGAVTCINPVNWKTDATPASFSYRELPGEVRVDTTLHVLLVDIEPESFHTWMDNPVFKSAGVSQDCLHHWDLLFYTDFIHDNALKRAQSNL